MPLPFLTADRAFDADAEDIALPFDDHDSWRRPYRPGPWRVAAAATLLLLASFVLLAAMIITFAGSLSGATVCFVVAGVVIACALRLLRVGAWVAGTAYAGWASSVRPPCGGRTPRRSARCSSR